MLGVALQFGLGYLFARQTKRYTSGLQGERVLALRAWAIGTLVNVVLTEIQLLLLQPEGDAIVAVSLYAFAVGIFAPMQFIFSRRVPRVPVEDLPVNRPSRAGLILTVLAAAAVIVLAAAGGITLG